MKNIYHDDSFNKESKDVFSKTSYDLIKEFNQSAPEKPLAAPDVDFTENQPVVAAEKKVSSRCSPDSASDSSCCLLCSYRCICSAALLSSAGSLSRWCKSGLSRFRCTQSGLSRLSSALSRTACCLSARTACTECISANSLQSASGYAGTFSTVYCTSTESISTACSRSGRPLEPGSRYTCSFPESRL